MCIRHIYSLVLGFNVLKKKKSHIEDNPTPPRVPCTLITLNYIN